MSNKIETVLIVGGGTAGWMTAAALAKVLGNACKITVVESDDIGTVGVGEATIPFIKNFHAMLNIDEAEFMRATQATFKLGIEFVDWGKIGDRYFHPFGSYGPYDALGLFHQDYYRLRAHGVIGAAQQVGDYSICQQAAYSGRAGPSGEQTGSPARNFHSAYHFDASLYAKFLRSFAEKRGVGRVEGEVVNVTLDGETGHVSQVTLRKGQTLGADIFIDCSGFRGLLIEGALKSGYQDWSHWLPMNRAVAVPCARVAPTAPYTRSRAVRGGWQWRIPLQHRTGNGYVYNSDAIGDDEAQASLVGNLDGEPLADARILKFQTGRRNDFWKANVVAIGLSAGFIEPLESTSIHLIHVSILRLLSHFPDKTFSAPNVAAFNRRIAGEFEEVRDFVVLHYHATARDDSPLWDHVRNMSVPDELAFRIDLFRDRGALISSPNDELFKHASWFAVLHGQGVTPRSYSPMMELESLSDTTRLFTTYESDVKARVRTMMTHDGYLAASGRWADTSPTTHAASAGHIVSRLSA